MHAAAQLGRRRVLLMMAGLRRNQPGNPGRPGLVLSGDLGDRKPPDLVFVFFPEGDAVAKTNAYALYEEIKQEHPHRCRVVKTARFPKGKPESLEEAQRVLGEAIDLRVFGVVGNHAADFYVSTATGAASHWTAIIGHLQTGDHRIHLCATVAEKGKHQPVPPMAIWPPPGTDRPRNVRVEMERMRHLPPSRVVLLLGQTGTGKSMAAKKLHELWGGKPEGLKEVNCAALPETLLESELFGCVKGAYTGADKDRVGLFEAAKGGTLLLDEIGEMPAHLQAKLLKVLDSANLTSDGKCERFFRKVGGANNDTTDARIVLATNKHLEDEVASGEFRDDLWARISGHVLELPPLVEQRPNVFLAYMSQLEKESRGYGGIRFELAGDARRMLVDFAASKESLWLHNYRDITKSAGRLALDAYLKICSVPLERVWREAHQEKQLRKRETEAERAARQERERSANAERGCSRNDLNLPEEALIDGEIMGREIVYLKESWRRLGGESGELPAGDAVDPVAWKSLGEALEEGELEKLPTIDRVEAAWLLAAKCAAGTDAQAWKWLQKRRVVASKETSNASDSFVKRWKRFRWRARPSKGGLDP
ncbi:MAG: sigma-54 factor interaction domain-containing protein [Myxococcales bacterium]